MERHPLPSGSSIRHGHDCDTEEPESGGPEKESSGNGNETEYVRDEFGMLNKTDCRVAWINAVKRLADTNQGKRRERGGSNLVS